MRFRGDLFEEGRRESTEEGILKESVPYHNSESLTKVIQPTA